LIFTEVTEIAGLGCLAVVRVIYQLKCLLKQAKI